MRRGEFPPPRAVNPVVPRPLEAVCLKAMALKPADRYASALALAADIEHWLADEPVTCWREPFGPRLRRWVRKHSRLVTATTVAFLVAAAGFGLLALERERARQAVANEQAATAKERDIAREQKRRTRAALDTMTSLGMIERLGSQKELTKGQREFLQTALDYYREFAAEAVTDEEGRKLEARACFRVAKILESLGDAKGAVPAFRAALAQYETVASGPAADPVNRSDLARIHTNLGVLLRDLGQVSAAEAELRAGLIGFKALADEFPAAAESQHDLAQTHNNLGALYLDKRQGAKAEIEFRAAVSAFGELVAETPGNGLYRRDLARSHNNLGTLLADTGRPTAASVEFRAALAEFEKLAAEFSAVPVYRLELAGTHMNMANLLRGQGHRSAAEAAYRSAQQTTEKLVFDFPAVPAYALQLAAIYLNLGNLMATADPKAALDWHTRAVQRLAPIFAAEPGLVSAKQPLRNAYWARARDLARLQRFAESLPDWDAAMKLDNGSARLRMRAGRAVCLAQSARAADAVREATEVATDAAATASVAYDCACAVSVASVAPDNLAAGAHAVRAVELLHQAIAKGYANIPHMLADPDLAPLHGRADYAALLWDLADMPTRRPPPASGTLARSPTTRQKCRGRPGGRPRPVTSRLPVNHSPAPTPPAPWRSAPGTPPGAPGGCRRACSP